MRFVILDFQKVTMVHQDFHVDQKLNKLLAEPGVDLVSCEAIDLDTRVDIALTRITFDCLPQTSLILSLIYCMLSWAHTLLPPSIGRPLTWTALLTSLAFFTIWGLLSHSKVSDRYAQAIGLGIAMLVMVNTFLHLGLSHDPLPSVFLVFILLGSGYFFLSTQALISVVGVTLLGWFTLTIGVIGESNSWLTYAILLVVSSGFAFVLHTARRKTVAQLENIRILDAQKTEAVQRRALQLQTLVTTVKKLHTTLDIDALLNYLVETIQKKFGYAYVGIFLLDENARTMLECAGKRPFDDEAPPLRIKVNGYGLISLAAATRQTIFSEDVGVDANYVPMTSVPNIQSELAIPLIVGDDLLGVLDIRTNKVRTIQAGDVEVFESLAGSVSAAIRNAMLYGVEHSRRVLTEKLYDIGRAVSGTLDLRQVLDLILDSLALIVKYDRASVLLESGNELEIVAARGYPPDSNPLNIRVKIKVNDIFHTIYRTKKPLRVPEILERPDWHQVEGLPQARSWAGLPLINAEDNVIGMLSLTRELPHPYSADEIALGAAFAGQAAVALQNARLYMQLSKAYADLEQLDKAKSDFITLVSHELRTPLTLLMGYSEMLNDSPHITVDGETHNMIDGIVRGGKRLYEIVERMIDVAEIDSHTLDLLYTRVNIPLLVREVVQDYAGALEERSIHLSTKDLEGVPPVECDRSQMKKVFYHLLMNSIKYTPDGGRVNISGRRVPAETCGHMGPALEIIVEDTGVGVAPEVQQAIFDKFYRVGDVTLHSSGDVKFMGGGPGLGLAIVKGIIEAHHGKVWVESPGFDLVHCPGSAFHILLPLAEPVESTPTEACENISS